MKKKSSSSCRVCVVFRPAVLVLYPCVYNSVSQTKEAEFKLRQGTAPKYAVKITNDKYGWGVELSRQD